MTHQEGHRGRNGFDREKIDCGAPRRNQLRNSYNAHVTCHISALVSFDFFSPVGLRQAGSPCTRRSRLSRSMPVSPRRSAVRPSSISPARMVRPRVTVASMQGVAVGRPRSSHPHRSRSPREPAYPWKRCRTPGRGDRDASAAPPAVQRMTAIFVRSSLILRFREVSELDRIAVLHSCRDGKAPGLAPTLGSQWLGRAGKR